MQPESYLENAIHEFRKMKELADKAMARITNEDFFAPLGEESNSIAIIVKHMAGNLRSRWMDFLTSDGEKPDRHRESEFVMEGGDTRDSLLARWEAGWRYLFDALMPLTPEDLNRAILIRSEPHTVMQAINRQLTHYAYHIGQIVFLARHYAGGDWQSLSIPRGKSETFNTMMREKTRKE
ncbi:MAG TPA: DUF1572 family protein [Blastocatellia bacterium]|nr:DUF1572 family protein [Blastocatellia bacterium]